MHRRIRDFSRDRPAIPATVSPGRNLPGTNALLMRIALAVVVDFIATIAAVGLVSAFPIAASDTGNPSGCPSVWQPGVRPFPFRSRRT